MISRMAAEMNGGGMPEFHGLTEVGSWIKSGLQQAFCSPDGACLGRMCWAGTMMGR